MVGVRTPAGQAVRHRYGTLAGLLGAGLDPGTEFTLLHTDGTLWVSGHIDANGRPKPHPTQDGLAYCADIAADTTYGYEVISGSLDTPVMVSGGTGYIATEVVTMVGGTISHGAITPGTAQSIVVDTVDGGTGAILTWHVSAATAGYGDYLVTPTIGSPVATTSSGAGVGATFTLSVLDTGFTTNAAGQWILNPKRTAGTPSFVIVRVRAMSEGAAGWWYPRMIGVNVEASAYDAAKATNDLNFELSTYFGWTIERLGSLDVTQHHIAGMFRYSTNWRAGSCMTDFSQGLGTTNIVVASGEQYAVELVIDQNDSAVSSQLEDPLVGAQVQDLGSTSRTALASAANGGSSKPSNQMPWTLNQTTTETNDRVFPSLIAYAGPTADDEQTWTVGSVYGRDCGWTERPLV